MYKERKASGVKGKKSKKTYSVSVEIADWVLRYFTLEAKRKKISRNTLLVQVIREYISASKFEQKVA